MRTGHLAIALAVVVSSGCGGSSSRRGGAATTAAGISTDLAVPGSLNLPSGDWTIGPVVTSDAPLPTEPVTPTPPVTPPAATTPRHWYVGDAQGGALKTHSPAEEKKAMALLGLVNCTRAAHKLRPLALDVDATKAAKAHAEDMLGRNYLGVSTPEGLTTADRLRLLGASGYGNASEVVATEPSGSCNSLVKVAKSWLSSGPSREALLSPGFTHVGIGVAAPEGKPAQLSAVLLQREGGSQ